MAKSVIATFATLCALFMTNVGASGFADLKYHKNKVVKALTGEELANKPVFEMLLNDFNGWNLPFATYTNATLTQGISGKIPMLLAVDMNAWYSVLFVDVDVPGDSTINYSFYDG